MTFIFTKRSMKPCSRIHVIKSFAIIEFSIKDDSGLESIKKNDWSDSLE